MSKKQSRTGSLVCLFASFRLIFMEDDEEKKAAKVSSWRDQNEEDGQVGEGIKEEGGWRGYRGREKRSREPQVWLFQEDAFIFTIKGLWMTQVVGGRAQLENSVFKK